MSNSTICVLSGLPASGKSSLAMHIVESVGKLTNGSNQFHSIMLIDYDLIIPDDILSEELQSATFSFGPKIEEDTSKWRLGRKHIVAACYQILSRLFNAHLHKNMEINSFEKIKAAIKNQSVLNACSDKCFLNKLDLYLTDDDADAINCDLQDEGQFCCNCKLLILVDDNNYFRSMRYEWRKLAQAYETGYCQINMKCALERILERNSSREQRVLDEVIHRMEAKFEAPNPDKFHWERHTLCITSEETDMARALELCSSLWNNALCNPEKQSWHMTEEELAEARAVTASNAVHQCDLVLRSIVSHFMASSKKHPGLDIRSSASFANSTKQMIIEDIRKQKLLIPPSFIQPAASKDLGSSLSRLLFEEFKNAIEVSELGSPYLNFFDDLN